MKDVAALEANMAAWKEHVAPEDREDFARAQVGAQEFIRFRTELVRRGNEEGQASARDWGDNEINRTNREGLNRDIDALARSNYADLADPRTVSEYSTSLFACCRDPAGGILLAILLIVLLVIPPEGRCDSGRIKEAYLAEAQRLSHTGSFGWNASGGFVWSEKPFESVRPRDPAHSRIGHSTNASGGPGRPDSRAWTPHAGDRELEHRLMMPDGSVKYLDVVAPALGDEAGEVSFIDRDGCQRSQRARSSA
jgi:hypothetical protein